MAIGQFAGFLRGAREKAGLTQAALAGKCGLTGSYISLLESGKKPAPSDRVVRRLATALALDAGAALEVAHMDRAPDDLRRSVERLRRQAAIERAMRERTAAALFPISLWNLLPDVPARATPGPPVPSPGASIVRAVERLLDLARSSPDLPTYLGESRRLLASLPEKDRRRILETAPALAQKAAGTPAPRPVQAPRAGLPPDVLPGDTLLVDDGLAPSAGDLVLVNTGEGTSLRRWEPGMKDVTAVVVEVRRRLRGR